MSYTYQYSGTPYTKVKGNQYSSANHITVRVNTSTALPAGLSLGDALPAGTTVAIGDGYSNYTTSPLEKICHLRKTQAWMVALL